MRYEVNAEQSIGIFDSGVGGLTVYNEIKKALPHERIIYFGDSLHLPYGDKDTCLIQKYSLDSISFLLEHEVKAIVIACNTASIYSIDEAKKISSNIIMGMIEVSVEKVLSTSISKNIVILATKKTIDSKVYEKLINDKCPNAKVFPIACPKLVPLIENYRKNSNALNQAIREILFSIYEEVDTVLLACTHYPLLEDIIKMYLPRHVQVVQGGELLAKRLKEQLIKNNLHSLHNNEEDMFYVTKNPNQFRILAHRYMGLNLKNVMRKK